MHIRAFLASDEAAVIALWNECGLLRPWNDPHKDIVRKLSEQPEMFLIGECGGELVASLMAGFDGHRGWLNYLAVAPALRHRSFGRLLVAEAERMLTERGCPKLNLQVRSSNAAVLAFYAKLGYAPDDVVSMGKRLIPD
ncbi:GNAT family acetyltransferase [Uliginosibacterium sp. H3]|uniref:GNAT family acetyltransferase n=1 Tax=Uliginosibacterium silvisoli TaxID=3114758 RepID=A0ABU6K6Q2_9RHOO|nr:GNAT family acetyltransferase [Uliginosibacterium sp. H3]